MDNSAYRIDKKRVRDSFGRAAASYDAAAIMQREVFERMFARLDLVKLAPQVILDAGCGTGLGTSRLAQRYKNSRVLALDIAPPMLQLAAARQPWLSRLAWRSRQAFVCGDIEALPLEDGSVDLAWSNLAMQWCNDLDLAFRELHRALRPEGLLMFSTFGPDTLMELREAASADPAHTHVSRFLDMHDIGDALVRAGFKDPVMDMERFTLTYDDVRGLMRDLKAIGARNATEGRRRGLEGKSFLQRLADNYERFRRQGKLPATYEVVYGHAWKAQPHPSLPGGAQPITLHRHK
ncbi:MAG TPA: malonyl-ACP O-methyltransferase BioC [Novimethylophilus sp.]|jgi:malonyl-CoA O-methyltransferase|uniref:malonyl-ACP O-methyltransferase BioC n=1 Tax=Novimethylophilus sp. TaxID=2137426 RepID=UPI002F42225B